VSAIEDRIEGISQTEVCSNICIVSSLRARERTCDCCGGGIIGKTVMIVVSSEGYRKGINYEIVSEIGGSDARVCSKM